MTGSTSGGDTIPITLEAARLLASSDSITGAGIVQAGGKWVVLLTGKRETYVIKTFRGDVRTCKSIDSAASIIRSIGLGSAVVKLSDWNPRQGEL